MLLFLSHLKTQTEIFYINILNPLNNSNSCLSPASNLITTKQILCGRKWTSVSASTLQTDIPLNRDVFDTAPSPNI